MTGGSNQHLLDLARRLQSVGSYAELAVVATDAMRARTRYHNAWLTLFDLERQVARVLGGGGVGDLEQVEKSEMLEFDISEDKMVQAILTSHEPLIIEDAPLDPRPNQAHVQAIGSRTIVNIPLLFDDRSLGCYGFGTFGDTGPMLPEPEEMEFLNGMASHMSVVIARLRAEERRRSVEAQLLRAQRLEAMGHLAGGVAHDFNNLLTAVLGNVELARSALPEGSPVAEFIDDIDDAATRAATLSRQLLAFAKRQVVAAQPVDLNLVISGLQSILTRLVPETIAIEHLPGRTLGTVLADPAQIEQVVMNLVLNAKDAMPEGGRLLIETENVLIDEEYRSTNPWAQVGRFVLLTVTDSGAGMPPEVLDRIFEPFFTTKGPERGTGLGLAVVFGVVEQHGGLVRVYSEPGLGTTFKIYLPIVERVAASVGTKIERPVKGGTEHILVAEDDERVRRVVHNTLAQMGYTVTVAEDGAEALELFEAAQPPVDLVISDVVMPNLDGASLWHTLKARHPKVPILIMSGYAANGLASRFAADEELIVVMKPFRSRELLLRVREALDRR